MNFKKIFFQSRLVLSVVICFQSCAKPGEIAYQKQVGIPAAKWDYKFQPVFQFHIPDTVSKYKVYLIFRHDDAYPNANLWVRLKVKTPADSVFSEGVRSEAVLAAPDGQWLGNGTGSIWEHKILLQQGVDYPKFDKVGIYAIKIEQVMRDNPLLSCLNVGLRVERLNVK